MQSTTIFLDFCDLGRHESKTEHWLLAILRERFDVRVATSPDFIIYGDEGEVHRMYTCYKIYLGGVETDFAECDYAVILENGKERDNRKSKIENRKILNLSAAQLAAADKQRVLDFFQGIFESKDKPVAARRRLFGRWLLVRRNKRIPL